MANPDLSSREYRCQVATEHGTRVVYVRATLDEGARDAAARWWGVAPEAVDVTPVDAGESP